MSRPATTTGTQMPGMHERDHFGRAIAAALLLEILAAVIVIRISTLAGPVANHRQQIIKIQMLEPPVKPKPLPQPKPMPKPKPLPKPLPPPPKPVAPPKPPPPVPRPMPHPRPKPVPRPAPVRPVPHIVPPEPAPPPQPAISAAEIESATERYAALLREAVQNNLRVPREVEMMHLRGTTTVAIRVAPNGTVLSVSVVHSSGVPPIDKAALATVRSTRFPEFLSKMPKTPQMFELQVKLRGR